MKPHNSDLLFEACRLICVSFVFPRVPVRQWVLSLPYALRYRLAYDAEMVTDILNIFTKTVFGSLIRRAVNSAPRATRSAAP